MLLKRLRVDSWSSRLGFGNTESALEQPRARSWLYWPKPPALNSSRTFHSLPLTTNHLPLSLSLFLSRSATPPPPQWTAWTNYSQSASVLCRVSVCGSLWDFTMKKESRLIRWIWWIVVVTALFLLGFIIGKRGEHNRNLRWTEM